MGLNKIVRAGKKSGPVLSRLWTKVHEILGQCRRPFVLSSAIACMTVYSHVSFRRYSPLSVEVVEKPNKCKSFLAPIFSEGRPQLFYSRLLARFTIRRLAKFGWVLFADLRLWSLAMTYRMQNLRRVGKMQVEFEAVCGPKFMTLWDYIGDPLQFSTHLTDCFVPKI